MSVIVKGMEMPPTCRNCKFREPFIDFAYCHLAEMDMEYEESDNCRNPKCPLVEIPTPHGRIIDADELKTAFPICDNSMDIKIASVRATINHAPTIIEAEGSEA